MGYRADLPHRQAPARDPADLPQTRRDDPRPRVLQLPRAGAESGAGRAHRRARPGRLLARDRRRSGLADRDRDRARGQTLHRPLRAASSRQPCLARGRRRAAADRPRRSSLLTPRPVRKCSAKPPAWRRLSLLLSYLGNRTVEDGPDCRIQIRRRFGNGPLKRGNIIVLTQYSMIYLVSSLLNRSWRKVTNIITINAKEREL